MLIDLPLTIQECIISFLDEELQNIIYTINKFNLRYYNINVERPFKFPLKYYNVENRNLYITLFQCIVQP